jgi:hypothetical protein
MEKFKIGDLTNLGKIMDITDKVKGQKLYYVVQEPIDINLVKSAPNGIWKLDSELVLINEK